MANPYIYIGRHCIITPPNEDRFVQDAASNIAIVGDDHVPMQFAGQSSQRTPTIVSDVWQGLGVTLRRGGSINDGVIARAGGVVPTNVRTPEVWTGALARKMPDSHAYPEYRDTHEDIIGPLVLPDFVERLTKYARLSSDESA